MRNLYSRYFPTPKFLAMSSCALDISDQSIKYAELVATPLGFRLGKFGSEDIPSGIIDSGKIINEAELVRILKATAVREHLHFVRISLPEEQMYLFTIKLPKINNGNLRDIIELSLEEHIPLKAGDTTFDFNIVSETADNIFVEVLAVATSTIESYLSILKKSGLVPLAFELEAQAIARAVIRWGDDSAVMIMDFGKNRTGVSIAHNGRVFFTTTLAIGGDTLTDMIAKNFSISFEEAEKMKLSYGLSSTSNLDDIFPAILNGLSVLRDELNKQYIYWKTHEDDDIVSHKLDRIILCGGASNMIGLSDYLEASMSLKVENANSWVNISNMKISVPDLSFEDSFGYATVLGLALGDYRDRDEPMINVLPDKEKKSLRREYWMRFSSILLSCLSLSLVVAVLLVIPSYFFSITKSNIASARLEAFNIANPDIATEDVNKSINSINSELALLSQGQPTSSVSDTIINDFVSNKTPGITLGHILYDESTAGARTISLQGRSQDRTTLRNFETALDSNPNFSNVNLPISDFIQSSNIEFNISITMK